MRQENRQVDAWEAMQRDGTAQRQRRGVYDGTSSWPGQRKSVHQIRQRKENWLLIQKRIRAWHVITLIVIVVTFTVLIIGQSSAARAKQREMIAAGETLHQAIEERSELARLVEFSKTEGFIEQQARDRYGYIRPNEIRFVREDIVRTPQSAPAGDE